MHLFEQPLPESDIGVSIQSTRHADVRRRGVDGFHANLRMARRHRERYTALASAAVKHAGRPKGGDLPLEQPKLVLVGPPSDQFVRLATDEDTEPSLEMPERQPAPKPVVLTLLGRQIGLAALYVHEKMADALRLRHVLWIRMCGRGHVDEGQRALDVVAV